MRIAVDAMGGDHAPQAIVEGVALAQQDFPDVEFILYGKEAEIKKYLTNEKNITIYYILYFGANRLDRSSFN